MLTKSCKTRDMSYKCRIGAVVDLRRRGSRDRNRRRRTRCSGHARRLVQAADNSPFHDGLSFAISEAATNECPSKAGCPPDFIRGATAAARQALYQCENGAALGLAAPRSGIE